MNSDIPITEVPSILDNEVHLWVVNTNTVQINLKELSFGEKERASRFVFEPGRRMFAATRYALRTILSHYLPGTSPALFGFSYGRYGKPALKTPEAGIDFNVSHSAGTAVLAFARNRAIGVDIESLSRGGDLNDIAKGSFSSSELKQLQGRSEAAFRHRFLELWTLKEAYIKARGLGLRLPLDKFSFAFQENSVSVSFLPPIIDSNDNWSFTLIKDQPEVMIALAAERKAGEETKLIIQKYPPAV